MMLATSAPITLGDESVPDGYVERVSSALPDTSLTIAKQAVIAGYERGTLTAEQAALFIGEFGLRAA